MRISSIFAGATLGLALAASSAATLAGPSGLLGVQVGYPLANFTSNTGQGASYSGGNLVVTSAPLFMTFTAGGTSEFIASGNLNITAAIDAGGSLSGGTFSISGTVTDTTTSSTYTGVLLSGTVADYGMSDISPSGGTDLSDFKLNPTGGQMLALYGTSQIGAIVALEGSTYAGNFAAPFGAVRAKGDYGPIPTVPPTACATIGTGTQGYWKNHASDWPVTSLTIGNTTYDQSALLSIFKRAPKGDKTIQMAVQLISAKLNVLNGACYDCVDATIAAADTWLAAHGGVASGTKSWDNGEELHQTLDDYNNGHLCAVHRN